MVTRRRSRDPVLEAVQVGADGGSSPLLGQLLLARGLSESQIGDALQRQAPSGKRLGEMLIDMGLVTEATLTESLAEQAGVEVIDLKDVRPDPDALALLPESVARSLSAVPIRRTKDEVEVAVADPTHPHLADLLHKAIGKKIVILAATPSHLLGLMNRTYTALAGIEDQVTAFKTAEGSRLSVVTTESAAVEYAPVVRVVDLLITQAFRDRASDIHVEPQEERLRIRFRIDGVLHDSVGLPREMGAAVVSRIKILARMNIVERHRPQDGQIQMDIDQRALDIRVSTTPVFWGEKAVLRLLDKSKPLFRLDDLGMAPAIQETFQEMIKSSFGMILCAGPTGSGKTTTLYATLNEINSTELNIMTVEDPVEYVFPSINQIQIKQSTGISFADGLRSILRQDPDIILVGEIRDVDTARIAVQSALTGHFVLSSMHATDAVSALHRFIDMGVEAFLLASAIRGIVGQRLVRRICFHCRVPHPATKDELSFMREFGGSPAKMLYSGEGCDSCSGTGYQDRVGVFELLEVTDELKQLIVRHASIEKLTSQAVKQGMRPMRTEAIRLVDEGITTVAELLRTIYT